MTVVLDVQGEVMLRTGGRSGPLAKPNESEITADLVAAGLAAAAAHVAGLTGDGLRAGY